MSQARTYELKTDVDVVVGRGLVVEVEPAGWAGWRWVYFADGTQSESVTINHIWELES